MKVAQRLSAGIQAVSEPESVKRTTEKSAAWVRFQPSAARTMDPMSDVPALKRWATIKQSASRTQQIDFAVLPGLKNSRSFSTLLNFKPLRFAPAWDNLPVMLRNTARCNWLKP